MAEFLRLAGDAVKKRETAILEADDNYSRSLEADDHKYFVFNDAQCRRLWKHLSAVSWAFVPSMFYSPRVQQKFHPLYKEFFNIVLRADEIAEKCSDKQSWLKEAIFLGGNRQVFQELSADLQSCMRNFHYLTRSLWHESQIPAPSSVIDVRPIPEAAQLDENFNRDVFSLISRLERGLRWRGVNFGNQEQHLARYIVDRGEFLRVQEPESELGPEPDYLESAKPKKLPFYEVHREGSVFVENLGGGAFGIVSQVKWLGLICAKKEFLNVESTVDFVKEVGALAALSHSRTVKLLCSNGEMPKPYFIMEFMPMTLERFCKRENVADSMRFEILPSINMMLQISSGMEYLHENGVVHRDLKSANILVRESHHRELRSEGYVDVKLTDFGLAKMKVSDKSTVATGRMGTTQWSSPEVLGILPNSPKPRIDWKKADTYSFAVVCSEILTGQRPYSEIWAGTRSIDSVISGELRPKLPKGCPPYLSEFLSRCWAHNPKDRPTFKEITQTLIGFKYCLLVGTAPDRTPKGFCPDPVEKDRFEAAVDDVYRRMETMEFLCSEMEEHLTRAQICRVQCGHLVKSYLEGFRKVKAVLKLVSPEDYWNLYTSEKLKKISESMDGLICSTMAVAEVVRGCGGSEWVITALIIFAALPQARGYCSIFGLHLWNLYWNLFVIDHAMHDVPPRQPIASLQLLSVSSTLRVQWCKERCKLVLQKVTSTWDEDGDGEFLEADADRRAEDRKNLVRSLSRDNDSPVSWYALIGSWFLSPVVPLRIGPAVFLRDRLWSTSDPRDLDLYKIDDLKLEAGTVIKGGAWKAVHKQKWCGELVAVSTYYEYRVEVFMYEVSMLAKLQHPNIVQFIGWKRDNSSQRGYIVTEPMDQDLHQLIERNTRPYRRSPFSLLVAIDILLQIVEAMIHIHKCGVIYRDLKPSNILVSPKPYTAYSYTQDLGVFYTVKLTDFYSAEMWNSSWPEAFKMPLSSECVFTTNYMGSRLYMAPEVEDPYNKVGYTYSVDTYSFGLTACQVTTGLLPFESLSRGDRVIQLGERPAFPRDYASGLKELIQKCWSRNPEERPSFEQIRKELWTLKYHESISR
ncbi:hypothetical protein M758_9G029000 [Ceratodon purpureus]|nr:hypothetical protein M758_9G029000 [Ceratodon purpureus]